MGSMGATDYPRWNNKVQFIMSLVTQEMSHTGFRAGPEGDKSPLVYTCRYNKLCQNYGQDISDY